MERLSESESLKKDITDLRRLASKLLAECRSQTVDRADSSLPELEREADRLGVLGGDCPPIAKRPAWKTPKHVEDKRRWAEFKRSTVVDALPKSADRLSFLENADAQIYRLLDYFQALGIPMGSSTWALRAELAVSRLVEEKMAASRVLTAISLGKTPDMERMVEEFLQAQRMHAKRLPPEEQKCDWCGWPGARSVGGGCSACKDCLPLTPEELEKKQDVTCATKSEPNK